MQESDTLRTLKGIGEKTERLFWKLGIYTVGDLLRYYPRDYDCYEEPISIANLVPGKKAAVKGRLAANIDIKNTGRVTVITAYVAEENNRLLLTWFNMPFLRNTLQRGGIYLFRGLVAEKNGRQTMEHPEIYSLDSYEKLLHTMQPIYSLTAGLSNKLLTKTVRLVLEEIGVVQDYLPEEFRTHYQLAEYNFAISQIHFPKDRDYLLLSRKRLVFDEFFLFILAIRRIKEKADTAENTFSIKPVWETQKVIEGLPYELTDAQKAVWREIERDMTGQVLMSRLVQGDVGSGKTIIAFLAMILAGANGYQSALMVPTEVLAKQHYEALLTLLKQHGLQAYAPVLLTGSLTAKQKRECCERIATGDALMVIGTHALIQEKVIYHRLALVITDEQHRFGVKQREVFSAKGNHPHILVMSATPIPRTLAIILYGDLDISVIDELPAKRLPIKNCVVGTSYRPKAYSFIENQVKEGRQAYIICPMVEESEGLDAENVIDYTLRLKGLFSDKFRIEALHGRMKASEKNEIMERFAQNEIQVLVSTTVIEVGVNVPNAVVMMVENAERFGLAQLHQLRGRVGRGSYQSYCIFMHGEEANRSKRLEILNQSNDGFFIAEEDLKLRGPGDIFGIRQSGLLEFKLADIFQDAKILKEASEAADALLALDFDLSLPQHEGIRKKLDSYMKNQLETLGL